MPDTTENILYKISAETEGTPLVESLRKEVSKLNTGMKKLVKNASDLNAAYPSFLNLFKEAAKIINDNVVALSSNNKVLKDLNKTTKGSIDLKKKSTGSSKDDSEETKNNTKTKKNNTNSILNNNKALSASLNILKKYIELLKLSASESANAFISFESAIQGLNSIAQEGTQAVSRVMQGVREIAKQKEVVQTPIQIAEAMTSLTQASFNLADSLSIASISAKGATAAMTDTETITSGLVKTMNTFGRRSVKDASLFLDDFFQIQKKGLLTVKQLTNNMAASNIAAAQLGEGFKTVGAGFIELTKVGFSASQANTRLSNLFSKITNATPDAREFAKEILNIDLSLKGVKEAGGFLQFMQKLSKAVGDNKDLVGQIFPEKRAKEAALVLLANNAEGLRKSLDDMNNTAGESQKALDEVLKATQATIDQIKSIFEDIKIGFGELIVSALKPFLVIIRDILSFISALPKEIKAIILVIGGLTGAIASLSAAFITLNGLALTFAGTNIAGVMKNFAVSTGFANTALLGLIQTLGVLVGVGGFFYLLDQAVMSLNDSTNIYLKTLGELLEKINLFGKIKDAFGQIEAQNQAVKDIKRNAEELNKQRKIAADLLVKERKEGSLTKEEYLQLSKALVTLSLDENRTIEDRKNLRQRSIEARKAAEDLGKAEKKRSEISIAQQDANFHAMQKNRNLTLAMIQDAVKFQKISGVQAKELLKLLDKNEKARIRAIEKQKKDAEKLNKDLKKFRESLSKAYIDATLNETEKALAIERNKHKERLAELNKFLSIGLISRKEYNERALQSVEILNAKISKIEKDALIKSIQLMEKKRKARKEFTEQAIDLEFGADLKTLQKQIDTANFLSNIQQISEDKRLEIIKESRDQQILIYQTIKKNFIDNEKEKEKIQEKINDLENKNREDQFKFTKKQNQNRINSHKKVIENEIKLENDLNTWILKLNDEELRDNQKLYELKKQSAIEFLNNEKKILKDRLAIQQEILKNEIENSKKTEGISKEQAEENKKRIEERKSQIKSLKNAIEKVNIEIKNNFIGTANVLISSIRSVGSAISSFQNQTSQEFGNIISNITQVGNSIVKVVSGDFTGVIDIVNQGLGLMASASNEINDDLKEASQNLQDATNFLQQISDTIANIEADLDPGDVFKQITKSVNEMDRALAPFDEKIKTLQSDLAKLKEDAKSPLNIFNPLDTSEKIAEINDKIADLQTKRSEYETALMKKRRKEVDEDTKKDVDAYLKRHIEITEMDQESYDKRQKIHILRLALIENEGLAEEEKALRIKQINDDFDEYERKRSNDLLELKINNIQVEENDIKGQIDKRKKLLDLELKRINEDTSKREDMKVELRKAAENKYDKFIKDLQEKRLKKITSLNEEEYKLKKKLIDDTLRARKKAIESELKQITDAIKKEQQAIKDLEDEFNKKRVEELLQRRDIADQLNKELDAQRQKTQGSFLRQTREEFDKISAIEEERIGFAFESGDFDVLQRNAAFRETALKKVIFFEDELSRTSKEDLETRQSLEKDINDAKRQYFQFARDFEREEVDKRQAEHQAELKRLEERKKEQEKDLKEVTEKQKNLIKELDETYKDSAGNWKTFLVNSTKDFVSEVKPLFEEITTDLQTKFEEFKQNVADITKEKIDSGLLDQTIDTSTGQAIDTGTTQGSTSTTTQQGQKKKSTISNTISKLRDFATQPHRLAGTILPAVGNVAKQIIDKYGQIKTVEPQKNQVTSFTDPFTAQFGSGVIPGSIGASGSFQSGSPNIPNDMIAKVHKNEMILKPNQANNAMNLTGTNSRGDLFRLLDGKQGNISNINNVNMVFAPSISVIGGDNATNTALLVENSVKKEFNKFKRQVAIK